MALTADRIKVIVLDGLTSAQVRWKREFVIN